VPESIPSRAIAAAAEAVGGFEHLALLLGVPQKVLTEWADGTTKIPPDLYARTVAIVHGEQ